MNKRETGKKNTVKDNETLMSEKEIIDVLVVMQDIPVPVHIYDNLQRGTDKNYDKESELLRLLVYYANEYRRARKEYSSNPYLIDDEFEYTMDTFLAYYDVNRPKLDSKKRNYWFGVRDDIVKKCEDLFGQERI